MTELIAKSPNRAEFEATFSAAECAVAWVAPALHHGEGGGDAG